MIARPLANAVFRACQILLFIWVPCAFASQPKTDFSLDEIAEGVFVHHGRHVDITHVERGDSANIGFVVGTQCVAVIDSGGAISTGRALLSVIENQTSVPVCYVINTHVHFDHVLGNAAFSHLNVDFVGHSNAIGAMTASRAYFQEEFSHELTSDNSNVVIAPTVIVDDHLRLELGERTLLLEAHARSHSDTDLTVLDKKTSTLFTGDLVFVDRLPIIDGELRAWVRWLETYRRKPFARIVPGHGPSNTPWPDGGEAIAQYLQTLVTDGRAAIRNGVFLEDAMGSMSYEAAKPWLVNERHPRNVSRAFRELEWE
ncbi:MAG: quinoprotein relay system zinc metallohydrolase 2 [Gammaproteobacteria bacterium]